MIIKSLRQHNKEICTIIDSIITMIDNKDMLIKNTSYYHSPKIKKEYLHSLYILKFVINNEDYILDKYKEYNNNIKKKFNKQIIDIDINKITNIEVNTIEELIIILKEKLLKELYKYEDNRIIFEDEHWIDTEWLISLIVLILDEKNNSIKKKDINVCYTIPNNSINKLNDIDKIDEFLNEFTFYNIKVKHSDSTKPIKENSILIIKNAAINYLKHLKQYKQELETEESYLIFYNLLKNECRKQGFILEEETGTLLNADQEYINRIKKYLEPNFTNLSLSRQIHAIENIVWQSSNDINILEQTNKYFDTFMDFISLLHEENDTLTYNKLKLVNNLNDIQILLILIIHKFITCYMFDNQKIDYSTLDLSKFKPEYTTSIRSKDEQLLVDKIHELEIDLLNWKNKVNTLKEERNNIDKNAIGEDKYHKEIARIVSDLNHSSVNISTINSKINNLYKDIEELRIKESSKYKNGELYTYNLSIIKHICNAIVSCNFYLKTNNKVDILDNIIIFEDYKKSDNSFYLEISFDDLLNICMFQNKDESEEILELPKLSKVGEL